MFSEENNSLKMSKHEWYFRKGLQGTVSGEKTHFTTAAMGRGMNITYNDAGRVTHRRGGAPRKSLQVPHCRHQESLPQVDFKDLWFA